MKEENLICTKCPMGCLLKLTIDGENIDVSGNNCKIGERYGISEYTNPVRIITTSVRLNTIKGIKIISVKTNKEVPKNLVFKCLDEIKKVTLDKESVLIGDVVLKNVLNLDVDFIATRNY